MNIHKNAKLTPLGREWKVNLPAARLASGQAGRDDAGGLVSLAEPRTHTRKGRYRCRRVPRHGQEMAGAFAYREVGGRYGASTV